MAQHAPVGELAGGVQVRWDVVGVAAEDDADERPCVVVVGVGSVWGDVDAEAVQGAQDLSEAMQIVPAADV